MKELEQDQDAQKDAVAEPKALTHPRRPKSHTAEDRYVDLRLRIGRANHLAWLTFFITLLVVGGAGYLWFEVNQLQKYAFAEGGIQDVAQLHSDVRQSRETLAGLRVRVDDLANVQSELGRVSNDVATIRGAMDELGKSTRARMDSAEQSVQQSLQAALGGLESRMTEAQTRLENLQGAADEMRGQMTAKLAQMEQAQMQFRTATEQTVAALEKEMTRGKTERVLAEVEHYIKVAQNRIQVDKATRAAHAALQAALQRLTELPDAKFTSLRERLQLDSAALQAVQEPDIDGIAVRITELQSTIEELPIKGMEKRFDVAGASAAEESDGMWDRAWTSVQQGLKKVVTIRRQGEPVMPLLAPEESFFLYQNIRLQLESARLALLQRDQKIYRDSLQNARDWCKKHLAATQRAEPVLTSLQHLATLTIDPPLPDVSATLQLLRDYTATTVPMPQALHP